jgi:glycosyltransferase 2 family protein
MKKASAKPFASELHQAKGRLLLLVFFLLLLYIILPRINSFSASFDALQDANPGLIVAALLIVPVPYLFAAGVYHVLALRLRGVRYQHTLLVQGASAFTNRLLPAGLGGLTLNVQYLRKNGHTLPQAVAVAGLNNTLGMSGHLLLLGVVLVTQGSAVVEQLDIPGSPTGWSVIAVAVAVALVNLVAFSRLRRYLSAFTRKVGVYLMSYRHKLGKLAVAQLFSLGLTSCYITIFYLCLLGLGIDLSLWSVFVVFTVGMIVGTATPTPGGLVGAEAGLVGGLVAYGVDAPQALAGVLLYRFLTYWLPLLPGFVLFLAIRRRYL